MNLTEVDICNLAQAKLGADEISSISAPRSTAERRYARLYPHYRDVELRARRWRFALAEQMTLQLLSERTGSDTFPYQYLIPPNCLRPLRDPGSRWKQVGQRIYSDDSGVLKIDYIRNDMATGEFDANFSEVLICRLAFEAAEKVTQSNTKKSDMWSARKDALMVAGQANAFITGPELTSHSDDDFDFLTSRL